MCFGVNKAHTYIYVHVQCRREKLLLVLEFNLVPTRKARHNSFNTRPLMCYEQQFARLESIKFTLCHADVVIFAQFLHNFGVLFTCGGCEWLL